VSERVPVGRSVVSGSGEGEAPDEPFGGLRVGFRPDDAAERTKMALVALIGNPNTGKSTLFNRLTGSRAKVGNYPGITVERRSGRMKLPAGTAEVLDLPGTYSLSARSPEEQIAIEAVLGLEGLVRPDLCVVVVDAGQLVRNLYLALQLIELEVPLVVAVNMIDEVDHPIATKALAKELGVPCVPISARSGKGMEGLTKAIAAALASPPVGRAEVDYPEDLIAALPPVVEALPEAWTHASPRRARALALWALASIEEDDELRHIPRALREACLTVGRTHPDLDGDIIEPRYALLDRVIQPLLEKASEPPRVARLTDRVDRVLLHPVWGFAAFLLVMFTVFQALFSWADPAIGVVEEGISALGGLAQSHLPPGFVADLVSEGIIGGVGNVVVFLPQICLLFLLLGLLEDSGYMARAAYLMDRIMKAVGLHGRAFVPMLSGCACAIPAIMATRTMERQRDRLLTMLVIPLMTCSARLPVYTLVIAALFPPSEVFGLVPVQGLLMVFMYVFSTMVALAAAAVLGRTVVKGRRIPLLLELPPYRLPTVRSVVRQTVERAGSFLKEAGTVILVFTIILWGALSYPKPEAPRPLPTKAVAGIHLAIAGEAVDLEAAADNTAAVAAYKSERLEGSAAGRLGHALAPVVAPLGFDWKLAVGIIGAFSAREVFISTMALIYGIGEADEASEPLRDKIRAESHADGAPVYTPLVGLTLMIFFALACQCMSTLAVVKRETKTWRWPAFLFAYMTTLAYVVCLIVYQGGRLLGFS
jgi:ferrous iron transport protein B